MKKLISILIILVIFITCTTTTTVSALVNAGDTATICSTGTTLRSEPEWGSAACQFDLLPNTKVTVVKNDGKSNGWSYISVNVKGTIYYGYVPTEGLVNSPSYTTNKSTNSNSVTTICSTGTTLRSKPEWGSATRRFDLLPNTKVTVVKNDGKSNGWSYISVNVKGTIYYGYVPTEGLVNSPSYTTNKSTNTETVSSTSSSSGKILGTYTIYSWDPEIERFWPSNNPGVNDSWGNMCAAARKLETVTIKNGHNFFWYTNIGYSNPEYGPGGVLQNGKSATGYAGGICATVNALKFALEDANMSQSGMFNIHTAIRHSKRSTYVPSYKTDCTVSYPSADFGFKNLSGYDITFDTACKQTRDERGNVTSYSLTVTVIVA